MKLNPILSLAFGFVALSAQAAPVTVPITEMFKNLPQALIQGGSFTANTNANIPGDVSPFLEFHGHSGGLINHSCEMSLSWRTSVQSPSNSSGEASLSNETTGVDRFLIRDGKDVAIFFDPANTVQINVSEDQSTTTLTFPNGIVTFVKGSDGKLDVTVENTSQLLKGKMGCLDLGPK